MEIGIHSPQASHHWVDGIIHKKISEQYIHLPVYMNMSMRKFRGGILWSWTAPYKDTEPFGGEWRAFARMWKCAPALLNVLRLFAACQLSAPGLGVCKRSGFGNNQMYLPNELCQEIKLFSRCNWCQNISTIHALCSCFLPSFEVIHYEILKPIERGWVAVLSMPVVWTVARVEFRWVSWKTRCPILTMLSSTSSKIWNVRVRCKRIKW